MRERAEKKFNYARAELIILGDYNNYKSQYHASVDGESFTQKLHEN